MQHIAVIGSTGSVGTQALEIIRRFPNDMRVTALSGHSNLALLAVQAAEFLPSVVGISDASLYEQAKQLMPEGTQIVCSERAHELVLDAPCTDTSLIAVVGFAGLRPLVHSIQRGLHTCVANKESIVCGGRAIRALLEATGQRIYPVDSEHSAIFQCLDGHDTDEVRRLILTCSGGAFYDLPKERIETADVSMALRHPTWTMGQKITIDSATLANKGLEVLEARWLFDVPFERIEVAVHRQSIVHSMVEWQDGSIIAQMGVPDMGLPIQYAFGYPKRLSLNVAPLSFEKLSLSFEHADTDRFPCLALAYEAGRRQGASALAFNAANDLAVDAFAKTRIGFYDIARIIERTMDRFRDAAEPPLDEIERLDADMRAYVRTIV